MKDADILTCKKKMAIMDQRIATLEACMVDVIAALEGVIDEVEGPAECPQECTQECTQHRDAKPPVHVKVYKKEVHID